MNITLIVVLIRGV